MQDFGVNVNTYMHMYPLCIGMVSKALPADGSIDLEVIANLVPRILSQETATKAYINIPQTEGQTTASLKTMSTQQGFSVTGGHYFNNHHLPS